MNKYQESIKNIRINTNKAYVDVCYHIAEKSKAMKYEDEVYKSCRVLEELVEKATPKQVINKQQFNINAGLSDDLELTIDICYCPTCQKSLYRFGTHCYHCGQALDWGDEE